VFSKDGLFDELKKALAERVLNAELDDHLDGEAVAGKVDHRNGYSKKTVLTETSKIDIKGSARSRGHFRSQAYPALSAPVSGLRASCFGESAPHSCPAFAVGALALITPVNSPVPLSVAQALKGHAT
jgi:hypothetical protein